MFEGFADVWTPVAFASTVRARPVAITLAGEPLVLFRTAEGVSALLDRCPHRGVALSLGKVEDGCLVCPFHGWAFERDGACRHVPYNPDAKRERLSARSFPTREVGGLVWVFTGHAAVGEPYVPEAVLDSSVARWEHAEEWACHWTRAMENMLDFPHLPFVHATTIGFGLRRSLRRDQRMTLDTVDTPTGFRLVGEVVGEPVADLRWNAPNGMELVISEGMRTHVWCVPTRPGRVNMILCNTRSWGAWAPPLKLVDQLNGWIVSQDRAICESSGPDPVPDPAEERSVATDKPTLRFRAYFRRHLLPSRADAA